MLGLCVCLQEFEVDSFAFKFMRNLGRNARLKDWRVNVIFDKSKSLRRRFFVCWE